MGLKGQVHFKDVLKQQLKKMFVKIENCVFCPPLLLGLGISLNHVSFSTMYTQNQVYSLLFTVVKSVYNCVWQTSADCGGVRMSCWIRKDIITWNETS